MVECFGEDKSMARYEEKKKLREKQRNKQKKGANKSNRTQVSYGFLAPLIAIFSFIPLVVYGHEFDTKLGVFDWYPANAETQYDFYLHSKMVLLIGACVYMIGALIVQYVLLHQKVQWTRMMIPLFLYGLLTLLSALVSDNSYFSFTGIIEIFEPVWLLLGYCLIAYYAYTFLQTEDNIKKILPWFLFGIAVMLGIGVAQALGHDPFRTSWGKELVLPSSMDASGLEFSASSARRPYLTLANRDYVGVYLILILPLILELFITAKKRWQRILFAVFLLVSMYVLYASGSKAAVLILPVPLLVMLFLHRRQVKKHWKIWLSGAFACAVFIGVVGYSRQDALLANIKNALTLTETSYSLNSIETKKDYVRFTIDDEYFDFKIMENAIGEDELDVRDAQGKVLETTYREDLDAYLSTDERFPVYFNCIQEAGFKGFFVYCGKDWFFSKEIVEGDDSYYAYENKKAIKLTKDTQKYNAFLTKHTSFAGGRGYIWARSLALLRKNFFLGSGPDTFLIAFPNEDLVGRYNGGVGQQFVTKPHSFYLQIGTQTGVPSLVILLVFFGWYIVDSVRLYWRPNVESVLTKVGIAILASVIGFLLMGLTNDSFNGVTAMFYLLLGMGIGINQTIKNSKEQKEEAE